MQKSIQKVFDLINKTGDRCIVLSESSDKAYVIMCIKEYERMVFGKTQISDLTEDEFLDKINRDIAVWKSQQTEEVNDPELDNEISPDFDDNLADISENYDWEEDEDEEEEPYYFEKV